MQKKYVIPGLVLIVAVVIFLVVRTALFNPEYSGKYFIEGGRVYYTFPLSGAAGMKSIELEGADPETFRIINSLYAEDKNHQYFKGIKVPGKLEKGVDVIRDVFEKSDSADSM